MATFNVIDVVIIASLTILVAGRYRRGFLTLSLGLVALILSAYLAFITYPHLKAIAVNAVGLPDPYANLLSFILLFAVFNALLDIATAHIARIIRAPLRVSFTLTYIDRLLGIVPTAIGSLIWISIVLGLFSWFPINLYIKDLVNSSFLGTPLVHAATILRPQAEQVAGKAIEDAAARLSPPRQNTAQEWRPNIPASVRVRFDPAGEEHMLNLVNKERQSRGLNALVPDERIRDVARAHSLDMVKNNYFSHESPTQGSLSRRLLTSGIIYISAGENIAFAGDVDIAHGLLMQSPGHRENILSPAFGRVGIGIVDAGPYGYMVTQDFTN